MQRYRTLIAGTLGVTAAGAAAVAALLFYRAEQVEQRWGMLDRYCIECHNSIDRSGGLTFEGLTPQSIGEHAEVFETAVRKLRGSLMPPPGGPQPDEDEVDTLIGWLESALDRAAPKTAGFVPVQRLNRTEFAQAVKGLLGVEIDPAEHLPTEIEVDGFTNIAEALSVSPAFLEQYVNVASTVAHLAVGEPVPKIATAYFPPPMEDQEAYIDGMPLGTRGGIRFTHAFPADGEYRITLTDLGAGLYPRALETEHALVVLVDRKEAFRETIGGPADLSLLDRGGAPAQAEIMSRFADIPLQVDAGVHEVVITFIERSRAASDENVSTFSPSRHFSFTGAPRVPGIVGGVDLIGPFGSTGLSQTRSREMLFVCEPEVTERERECAERIAANLARRAFRRPIEQSDLDRLMPFYEEGRTGPGGFDEGIELMVTAVLASPDFLYRAIAAPENAAGDSFRLDDFQLASRLSFFLWSEGPDDELLDLAARGELSRPEVFEAEVARMLADPRAEVLVTNFALPWLNLDDLDAVQPDMLLYPEFTEGLREDFATEVELFVRSILLGDASVQTLLTAEHTFLNERLARHYGVPGVVGPQFRRVRLGDQARHGLLGKGAVLLRTSYGDRTSPVLRGAWVLDKLMGTPPAPPPPNVETDLTTPEGEQPKTVRVRLEQHRESPTCNGCHGVIDPYGLALENFTATGQWRDYDAEADAPIDASTVLPSGKAISSPIELRDALLRRPDQFIQALTEKLMTYGLGRELEHYDMPEVRAIVRAAANEDYRFSAIVTAIATSDAFRTQALPRERESLQTSRRDTDATDQQSERE
jgi:mono/diheme cytochrome c family protein